MSKLIKIAPSILSADFSTLGKEIEDITAAGADYIHVDVMDGHFVPNLTIGPCVVKSVRSNSDKIFDVHLMIESPEKYIRQFAEAGADIITIHYEATDDVLSVVKDIKALGKCAGISIKPGTDVSVLKNVIQEIDLVLVMSVEPGFGGQGFIEDSLDKISQIRVMIDDSGRKIDLEVDGGINVDTAKLAIAAGADVLVAGSAVFRGNAEEYKNNIDKLR